MTDRATYMRGSLASVGILIDPPIAPAKPVALQPPPPEIDRARVRQLLESAGAPAQDLDWLVRSCPSIEAARGYKPPAYARPRSP